MVMLRSYMCPKLTIYIYISYISSTFPPLSSACVFWNHGHHWLPPATFPVVNRLAGGSSKTVGHREGDLSRWRGQRPPPWHTGRVTKNWLPPQGLENFLVEKNCRALGWKMMEYYALFNSICNIVLKDAKYLVGIKTCIYIYIYMYTF